MYSLVLVSVSYGLVHSVIPCGALYGAFETADNDKASFCTKPCALQPASERRAQQLDVS